MATEKRLIDANAYCKELYAEKDYPGRTEDFVSAMEVAIADLGDMPTVDAVEVVRCKDCYYGVYAGFGKVMCDLHPIVEKAHFYCASGERKDNG